MPCFNQFIQVGFPHSPPQPLLLLSLSLSKKKKKKYNKMFEKKREEILIFEIVSDVASLVKRKPPHWSKLFNMSGIVREEEEEVRVICNVSSLFSRLLFFYFIFRPRKFFQSFLCTARWRWWRTRDRSLKKNSTITNRCREIECFRKLLIGFPPFFFYNIRFITFTKCVGFYLS
jgi:hypothetical protein